MAQMIGRFLPKHIWHPFSPRPILILPRLNMPGYFKTPVGPQQAIESRPRRLLTPGRILIISQFRVPEASVRACTIDMFLLFCHWTSAEHSQSTNHEPTHLDFDL